ncbi:tetratricopeptide repeat protein [Sphingomonas sp.]|uniref:tetratricopeptide repeat protein n=1 Tax=Sphingomonas sp. TaxID=28214 RepID=UPI00286D37F9|nr:tetratricopeptide repeat protein [Sphingomonas sp.]
MRVGVGLSAAITAVPALAQSDQDIEALVAESQAPVDPVATARQQIAAGDLTGAVASLDRALLENPNATDARLLYAATLCRLGDPQGARIEMGKLNRQDVGQAMFDETNQACGGALARPASAQADGGSGVSGEVYGGLAYDYDASGALALQTDFFGSSGRNDGFSLISGARLTARSSSYAGTGGFYGGFSVSSKHDISGPRLDYDIGELRAGFGSNAGKIGFSIGPVVRHIRLFDDPYVTEYGGQGELVFGGAQTHHIRLRLESVYQNYDNRNFPGNDADGVRLDLSAAYEARVGESGFVTVGAAGEYKDAEERNFGYRGGRLFAAYQHSFANRDYLTLSGTLRHIDFRNASFVSDRMDTRAYGRLAYAIALGTSGLFVEWAATYTHRRSKISDSFLKLRTYNSPGAEARVIWKF